MVIVLSRVSVCFDFTISAISSFNMRLNIRNHFGYEAKVNVVSLIKYIARWGSEPQQQCHTLTTNGCNWLNQFISHNKELERLSTTRDVLWAARYNIMACHFVETTAQVDDNMEFCIGNLYCRCNKGIRKRWWWKLTEKINRRLLI